MKQEFQKHDQTKLKTSSNTKHLKRYYLIISKAYIAYISMKAEYLDHNSKTATRWWLQPA